MPENGSTDSGPPPVLRDPSFWGLTVAQFLGAFNDNLFKQTVLLACIDLARALRGEATDQPIVDHWQPVAQIVFALPFVLFSGFAGFIADRYSKRSIILLCKFAEVAIMLLGAFALAAALPQIAAAGPVHAAKWTTWNSPLLPVMLVLAALGTHSAFFGPPKYGVLPQLFRESELTTANGIFLMTTFLSIILGTVGAGFLKGALLKYGAALGMVYVALAVVGAVAASLARKTPPVQPRLTVHLEDMFVSRSTFKSIVGDRVLLWAIVMSTAFWFCGGVVVPAVNNFGKQWLYANVPGVVSNDELTILADQRTSLLQGGLCLGIAAGCLGVGLISRKQAQLWLVPVGAWGIVASLLAATLLGTLATPGPVVAIVAGVLFCLLGVATGVFTVPLQVLLQCRSPVEAKGRVLGAVNVANWIGILSAGVFYSIMDRIGSAQGWPPAAQFVALAAVFLPIAIFYHPAKSVELSPAAAMTGESSG